MRLRRQIRFDSEGTIRRNQMTNETQNLEPLSREELDELTGEALPERAAMSLINANVAIPINAAVAANVLSSGSPAVADAPQGG
jgi:hypothetical protein